MPGGKASEAFTEDDAEDSQYYGRGYVQLTWWDNYAATGVVLGRGLDLLLDPDLVLDPDLSYLIMATGMRTGTCFANRNKFSKYFFGAHSDYVRARNMVNPKAEPEAKKEVAHIAERFAAVLLVSRVQSPKVANK